MKADDRAPIPPGDGGRAPGEGEPSLTTLLADQRSRWQRGERRLAEDYLAQQPALQINAEAALDLLAHEILLRQEQGEAPDLAEYQRRFPHLAEPLRIQFEVEHLIQADAPSASLPRQGEPLTVGPDSRLPGLPDAPVVPGYELLGELGRGGMGVVYKAHQVHLDRVVALKMIRAGVWATPQEVVRFLAEAKAVAAIAHPGIVGVFDFGTHNGLPFFALEWCAGGSLADKLQGKPLPPRQAATLLEQLARAVEAAHQCGIVHRDLKPSNILLDAAGTAKVADFGLAKRLEGGDGLTRTGDVMGTPSYMAPEQALGRRDVAPASDVYALGAVLYECLTGRPPFRAATDYETLLQVVAEEPVPVRQLQPHTPIELETICHKCLQKDPEGRYPSAAALAEDLRRFQAGEPIAARPVGRIARVVKWVRRRPVIAALSAAVVVALATGTLVSLHFGLQARQKETEAREALKAVEDNLAVGLMRPLGHFRNDDVAALTDFELGALEELAGLPRERDRVRLLFIARALEEPGTAGQLGRRLESAVIAAVGLRQDLRRQVMHEAAARLQDARTPHETKVVCAQLLAQMRCQQEDWVVPAATTLVVEMARETDWASLLVLSKAFAALTSKLSAEQAGWQAGRIVELADKTNDPRSLTTLSGVFATLAGKLSGEQASSLAGRIVELAARKKDPPVLRTLMEGFVGLAGKMPAKQASSLADRIVELAARMKDPASLFDLSLAFAALADKLSAEQVARQAAALTDRIVERTAKTTDIGSLHTLSLAFAALAGKLSPERAAKQAAALANRIVELAAKTTNPDSLTALSLVFATLAGKLSAEQAAKRAAALADRIVELPAKKSDSGLHAPLWEAFAAIAGKLSAEQAAKQAAPLANRLVELAAKTMDLDSLHTLSLAFAVLAGKLSAEQAAKQSAPLAGEMIVSRGVDAVHDFRTLSLAFAALVGKLSGEQAAKLAGALADRIVELAVKTTNPDSLTGLSLVFAALADKLSAEQVAKQTAALADRIVELAARKKDPASQLDLSTALTAVTGKLSAEQTAKLADRIVELAARTKDPESLFDLLRAIAGVVGKLSAEQTAKLADHIVELAAKTPDPGSLATLSYAYAALAGKLSDKQAAKLAATLADRIVELAAHKIELGVPMTLSIVFAAVASKLSADQAAKHAATLADLIVDLAAMQEDPASLLHLLNAYADVAGKLSAEQAAKQAAALADRVVELAAKPTRVEVIPLSQAFAALAGKLSAKQAFVLADRIVELAAKTTDRGSLTTLSKVFATLADKLSAEQAAKHAGALVGRIVELAAKKNSRGSLTTLMEAYTALAGKLPAEQTMPLAGRIVELAARTTNPDSLSFLSAAFAALGGGRKENEASALVLRLARSSHRDSKRVGGLGPLDRLLGQLSSQTILEALKQPGCIGTTRTTLLAHLGKRHKRSFRDVWELVDYLKESAPELDLDSPLAPAKATPLAEIRIPTGEEVPEDD